MIYGMCRIGDIDNNYKQVCEQLEYTTNLDGVVINLHEYKISDNLTHVCNFLKERKIDIIIGFKATSHKKYKEDFSHAEKFIEEIKKITNKISLGNTRLIEWVGNLGTTKRYHEFAKKMDIEWICSFIHRALSLDCRNKWLVRNYLAEHNIPIFCYCGYILAGYLWDDHLIPSLWYTSLRYKNLYKEFNLTVEKLSNYLEPLNIVSGAGGQIGIVAGSLPYLKRLNFKGFISSVPFTIKELDNPKVYERHADGVKSCGPLPDENERYAFKRPSHVQLKNEILEISLESFFRNGSSTDNFIVLFTFKPYMWKEVFHSLNFREIQKAFEKYREGYDIIVNCKDRKISLLDLWQCTNIYSYQWMPEYFESL